MRKKIYELYDLEGNKITEGSAIFLADYCHCEESSIREASNKPSFMKMYVVKRTNRREEVRKAKESDPSPTYETNPYECLKMHLKMYGNTVVSFDPVPYFPWLLDEGINCKCHEYQDVDFKDVSRRGRKPKPKYHYLVEVVNARRGSESV